MLAYSGVKARSGLFPKTLSNDLTEMAGEPALVSGINPGFATVGAAKPLLVIWASS
jgi:hypothetical protein